MKIMTLHAKNLLIEMREYTKNKIQNANLSPFVPSTEELRKIYNKVSCADMSLYEEDDVIKELEDMATAESLDFSEQSQAVAEESAAEVEKIDENSTDEEKQSVKDKLNSDRRKNIEIAKDKIDKVYDNLIEAVDKNPDKTDGILNVSSTFSRGFGDVVNEVIGFIQEVIQTLVEIAEKIWDFIENTYNKIKEIISRWFPSSVFA